MTTFVGQKKIRDSFPDDIADGDSAVGSGLAARRQLDRVHEQRVELDAYLPAPGSNCSCTHQEERLPRAKTLVNNNLPFVERLLPMSYDKAQFGAFLCSLRGKRTGEEIALAIDVSRETYVQMETGHRKTWPSPDIFNALARTFGVPVTRLLRAAGADIPITRAEQLEWLADQLDDEGIERLGELGLALLPRHRRRLETAESPPPTLRAVAEDPEPYDSGPPARIPRHPQP